MKDKDIPNSWQLGADPRYIKSNMSRAMGTKIERALVELITNADDSYRDLEDSGKKVSGKIRIEVNRKRKGRVSVVKVKDRAEGMDRAELYRKIGELGRRESGFEKGKARRGIHGRGARDVAHFGTVHFESIKDDRYNHLILPPSLKLRFQNSPSQSATKRKRDELGIPGNGTVVKIEVGSRFKIPHHENLLNDLSRHYSLRDLLSKESRHVLLVDLNQQREDRLRYIPPEGEIVFDDDVSIPDYPDCSPHLVVRKHLTPFEREQLPYKEGILVASASGIHDCTHFGLESEPLARHFSGRVTCDYIDNLIREYDQREESNPDNPGHPSNNPARLLSPEREGLIADHPFRQCLYDQCRGILKDLVEKLKASEEKQRRKVANDNLKRKLEKLSKSVSKLFETKMQELEEEYPPGTDPVGDTEQIPLGLHFKPANEYSIRIGEPKIFTIVVKDTVPLDEALPVIVECSDGSISAEPSEAFFKRLGDGKRIGWTTCRVEGKNVGEVAILEARYRGFEDLLLVKVVERKHAEPIPDGLSFEKPHYYLSLNKEKSLKVRLKTDENMGEETWVSISSDHAEIVPKAGGKCRLKKSDDGLLMVGTCRVQGRQLKAKGAITAEIDGFAPAQTKVEVVERQPSSSIKLKFEPVEEDFGSVRYKWDDEGSYLLYIGALHPAIRKYLGAPENGQYPGLDDPRYHAVLAEVISEAMAFRILRSLFRTQGDNAMLDFETTDLYFHRYFSDFLKVAHTLLVA